MKSDILLFDRPEHLQASTPPEDRSSTRDNVRLLITTPGGRIHAQFKDLHEFLVPGDLLVVNESAVVPASLPAEGPVGKFVLNLSTNYGNGLLLAEPRWSSGTPGPLPLQEGEEIWLPGLDGRLVSRYPGLARLWFVQLHGDVDTTVAEHGSPIHYGYLDRDYPLEAYQTIFARVPGSAEMPSAARPFTRRILDSLTDRGVDILPIVLHTGVSSLEVESEDLEDQVMYAEPFQVSAATAQAGERREGQRPARYCGWHDSSESPGVCVGSGRGETRIRVHEALYTPGAGCSRSGWAAYWISRSNGKSFGDAIRDRR